MTKKIITWAVGIIFGLAMAFLTFIVKALSMGGEPAVPIFFLAFLNAVPWGLRSILPFLIIGHDIFGFTLLIIYWIAVFVYIIKYLFLKKYLIALYIITGVISLHSLIVMIDVLFNNL